MTEKKILLHSNYFYFLNTIFAIAVIIGIVYFVQLNSDKHIACHNKINLLNKISYEITTAHLWFEEILSGDTSTKISSVWKKLNNADKDLKIFVEGGVYQRNKIVPLADQKYKDKAINAYRLLTDLEYIAKQRYRDRKNAYPGSKIDQEFDKVFNNLNREIDTLEKSLDTKAYYEIISLRNILYLVIFIVILLVIVFNFVLFSFDKQRLKNLQVIEETNAKLKLKQDELIAQNRKLEESQKELKNLNNMFESITDGVSDAIIMLDLEGILLFWNQSAEKLFGYSTEEAIGQRVNELIIPESSQDLYIKFIEQCSETGTPDLFEKRNEYPVKNKEGEVFMGEFSLSPVYLEGKLNVVGVFRDISERKEFERKLEEEKDNLELAVNIRTRELKEFLMKLESTNLQLREANQHKNRFLSTMSHELRTPLNAILGFSDILKQKLYGDLNDKQKEYVSYIKSSGQHLLDLINDILDIAKIDSGSMEFVTEKFSVSEIINEINSLMSAQYKDKNILLETYIQPGIPLVIADRLKCKQILLNLLSNAVKYTDEGGKIIVAAEMWPVNRVKITVTDTGIGIDEANIGKIFKEFIQLDYTRDKALGGTGIGLALTKKLVEMHNGEIGVESKLREGSSFWFILPLDS